MAASSSSSAASPAHIDASFRWYNPATDTEAVRQLLLSGRLDGNLHTVEGRLGLVAVTPAGYVVGVIIFEKQDAPPNKKHDIIRRYGLAVSPPWRSRGIGKALVTQLERLYAKRKVTLWPVPPQPGETRNIRDYHRAAGYQTDSDNDWFMSKKPRGRRR